MPEMSKKMDKKILLVPAGEHGARSFLFFLLALVMGNFLFVFIAMFLLTISLPQIWILVISFLITASFIFLAYLRYYYKFTYSHKTIAVDQLSKKKNNTTMLSWVGGIVLGIPMIILIRAIFSFLAPNAVSVVYVNTIPSSMYTAVVSTPILNMSSQNTVNVSMPNIPLAISVVRSSAPTLVHEDGLSVSYSIKCSCVDSKLRASILLKPLNGTPPYIIPGYGFFQQQLFVGDLGDIYDIVIRSSDTPPLTWRGDVVLDCSMPMSCDATMSPPELANMNASPIEYCSPDNQLHGLCKKK